MEVQIAARAQLAEARVFLQRRGIGMLGQHDLSCLPRAGEAGAEGEIEMHFRKGNPGGARFFNAPLGQRGNLGIARGAHGRRRIVHKAVPHQVDAPPPGGAGQRAHQRETPQSFRICSVCSPRPGGRPWIAPGVSEKRGAGAG